MRDWLKNIRRMKGVKQKEVAAYADISRSYYANIESGNKTPSVVVAKKIANYFKFEWSQFY
ncbi:helix-turn-helix transcriptional regulator [Lysinibacillus sp. NPDC047702]|uniref:helix-turn-helix transcriptional regulator n=1 Tax=unclassified Lysinibacillus TaxID=2636778 RepID=UPI003D00EE19